MADIDFNLMPVFEALYEERRVGRAALRLGRTQSAVSQQITSLERQFKSLLIERSKKKFRLTREGQLLYEHSKQIIETYDSLFHKLQEIKDIISGTIRVSTIREHEQHTTYHQWRKEVAIRHIKCNACLAQYAI